MRKIFIDLGGHIGESIDYFRSHWPDWEEYEYFVFEPYPENIDKLKMYSGVTVIEAAATIYNSSANFYTGLPQSGSLSDKKRTGKLDGKTHISVKTIDFTEWFERNVIYGSEQNYIPEVIIKMNIEGAEYDILDKMHVNNMIHFVNKWYIQWHAKKIQLPDDQHERISSLISWLPWEVM